MKGPFGRIKEDQSLIKQTMKKTTAGQYEIIQKLGRGEHGVIYLGTYDHQLVAIKKVSEHYRATHIAEFSLLPKLNHPNIIKIINPKENTCAIEDTDTLLLEYASNGDLQSYATENFSAHIPQEILVSWLCQLCLALSYLHNEVRVLHRDIKTKNILVMENGLLKLADFGTARQLLKHEDFAMTSVGTPYYLSPEAVGLSRYNNKSDVWGLGCIMFELCTGTKPFLGKSLNDLIKQILNEDAPEIPERYSEWFRTLIKSMLEKNPEKRITIENILERGQIREAFLQLKQKYEAEYRDFIYPVAQLKTKKYKDREEMPRGAFCSESLKTVKNQKSIKLQVIEWKKDLKQSHKKQIRKVEINKFKDRSLKSIIEKRKHMGRLNQE